MEDIIKEHIEKEIKKRTLHIRLYEESIQKSTNEEYIRPSLEKIRENTEIIEALSNKQTDTPGFILARKLYSGELMFDICMWCRKTSHLTDVQFREDFMEKRDHRYKIIKAFDDFERIRRDTAVIEALRNKQIDTEGFQSARIDYESKLNKAVSNWLSRVSVC